MQNYNKLDVAAKMFPSVSDKNNSSVFRVSIILKEKIDEHILQLAVDMIYQRYKLFFLRLRRGVFWHYFDYNYYRFKVEKESESPCTTINSFENNGYIIKVLYYNNRISVEAFHSVTDGSGIVEFLKSLVYYYLDIKYKNINHQGKILLFDEVENNDNDSFSDYFKDLPKKKRVTKNKYNKSFRIKGEKFKKRGHSVITGIVSVNAIKTYYKKHNCTLTACLIANLIWSIYEAKQKNSDNRERIVISVPVNLRKTFDSKTLKNFFAVIQVSYIMSEKTIFEQLLNSVSNQLSQNTQQEYLKDASKKNVDISNNIFCKNTPLILKNVIIPIGFNYMSERKKTINLSNIGKIDLPDDVLKYTEHMEVYAYPTNKSPIFCTVCSCADKLSINFIRSIKDASMIRCFFKSLVENTGADISVYSNKWGESYE